MSESPDSPMPGVQRWKTKKGWRVFRLHYTADPDKRSKEWRETAMNAMPDLQSFNREYEIDWQSTTGQPFYPLFYKTYAQEKSYYVRALNIPAKGVIYRGFDFGFRKPACVWTTQSQDGRLHVLREFSPENIDVYQFRDAVKVLSGELAFAQLDPERHERAITWLERIEAPEWPWFKPDANFVNFSGPEATAVYSAPGKEKSEMNDADVFDGGGIHLNIINQRVSAGTYILRHLMRHIDDTGSNLLIDPSCQSLIQGFAGQLTFGIGTKANPLDEEVAVHPIYSHMHDALRYVVTGIYSVTDIKTEINKGAVPVPPRPVNSRAEPPRHGPGAIDTSEQVFWATIED